MTSPAASDCLSSMLQPCSETLWLLCNRQHDFTRFVFPQIEAPLSEGNHVELINRFTFLMKAFRNISASLSVTGPYIKMRCTSQDARYELAAKGSNDTRCDAGNCLREALGGLVTLRSYDIPLSLYDQRCSKYNVDHTSVSNQEQITIIGSMVLASDY